MPTLAGTAVRLAESSGTGPTLDIPMQVWAITLGAIVLLFTVDLVISGRNPHAVGYREATAWSVFYITVAVVFGLVLASQVGWGFYGAQYFAGYIVEKSLSIDNLFVFVIIMATFAVPRSTSSGVLIFRHHRLPLALRAVFIAVGATLLSLLVLHVPDLRAAAAGGPAAWQLYLVTAARTPIRGNNALVCGCLTPDIAGYHFYLRRWLDLRRAGGRRVGQARRCFIVFITIGGTDILFARRFGTRRVRHQGRPLLRVRDDAFALMGLRALFFVVTGLLSRLVYL